MAKKLLIGGGIFVAIFLMLFVVLFGGGHKKGTYEYKDGYMSGTMSPDQYDKLKDLVKGDSLGDRMLSLQGKITYNSTDGTNCMRTVSIAMNPNDERYSWLGDGSVVSVPTAKELAQEKGYYEDFQGFDKLEPGDILIYDGDSHVGVVSDRGTLIQNGASKGTVYEAEIDHNGTPTGVIKAHKK